MGNTRGTHTFIPALGYLLSTPVAFTISLILCARYIISDPDGDYILLHSGVLP